MARILIVDDDLVSLLYMEQILKSLGHTVVNKAKSGPEGVSKAQALKPEIVFMDISMPGEYDGIEAARIIENDFGIPIIFITAYEIDQFLHRVQEVQPFGYIMKPFKEVEVKASIFIALYRQQMESKLTKAIKKNRKSLFSQILISNLLVELNKTTDIYDRIENLMELIRNTMDIDSIILLKLDNNSQLSIICSTFRSTYKDINIPEKIDLGDFFITEKFTIENLKVNNYIKRLEIFPENIQIHLKNIKSLITNPLFVDNELFGIMLTACFDNKKVDIDLRRNLKSISRAISLMIKRHFDFIKFKKIEKEKQIKEKIDIRKERLATLGQLTSAITHEVNQPLQSIKLLSESPIFWIEEKNEIPLEKLLDNFRKISERVNRINDIITNLRLLIQAPDKIIIEPHDINNLIYSFKTLIEAKLNTHGIQCVLELEENPKKILVCGIQFQQILTDIVDNAVKALDTLSKTNKKVIINTKQNDGFLLLTISDNGPGIKNEIKNQIFEPFFSSNTKSDGMGLGLYIVYNIIKTFGGQIHVNDNEFGGASFEIRLNNA